MIAGQSKTMSKTIVRHSENPFFRDLVITKKKKQVRVSELGKDSNILINTSTGEVHGTHVVTYKQVDDAEFVKLFAQNIALTFGLTSAGLKSLNVLIWAIQNTAINKDLVMMESTVLVDFLLAHDGLKLSQATFDRGLRELCLNKIIAKYKKPGFYFINPNFVFNGDRIAFTNAIERKKKQGSNEDQSEIGFDEDEGN